MSDDIAGVDYWDDLWSRAALPRPVNPTDPTLRNHVNRELHRLFEGIMARVDTDGARLIEIGCGGSKWLPYFGRQFGLSVSGLDYSPGGCDLSRRILESEGVDGEIVCASLFSPPDRLLGRFDVAVTFGVVEHFADTAGAIRAKARLVRPGGRVITIIPNMRGAVGLAQRTLNRPVYEVHVPLDDEELARAHIDAGLDVEESSYALSTHFGVTNLNGVCDREGRVRGAALDVAWRALIGVSAAAWWLERRGVRLKANPWSSPYVVCVARLPDVGGVAHHESEDLDVKLA